MMMSLKACFTALVPVAVLSACGDTPTPAKSDTKNTTAEAVAPAMTLNQFADSLSANGAVLRLTECDANDAADGYTGEDDPFGVLVCQSDYAVSYDAAAGKWIVAGPKERLGVAADALPQMTHGYAGTAPREGSMVVWGGVYRFDATGAVYPARRGEATIGQLTLNNG